MGRQQCHYFARDNTVVYVNPTTQKEHLFLTVYGDTEATMTPE